MYQHAFQPKTNFGKKVIEQIPLYYTTDIKHLKDCQTLLKNYKSVECEVFSPDFDHIMELWDEVKNDNEVENYNFPDNFQHL
jgi:hypothetical protein